uniref:thiamin pyrophosphokinase 1-like n=1 Tax=Styela clava TaxID=7725 RepID=UPI00193AD121|nr:thiamin pyrophosphokinase 1-like [Styela clava]
MMRFCPLQCIKSAKNNAEKIAVTILNMDTGCDISQSIFHRLWDQAIFRACIDGGANFVHDIIHKDTTCGFTRHMPDFVCGDFDSIRPEVKQFYESQSETVVTQTPDQDATDFTKGLRLIAERLHQKNLDIDVIVALGGKQDKLDHSMANIDSLYAAMKFLPRCVRTCLIYDSCYICLLPMGKSAIEVNTGMEGDWCGLVPIRRRVTLTTTGLQKNFNNDKLEFGGVENVSNKLDGSEEVIVETDHPLVWTMHFEA